MNLIAIMKRTKLFAAINKTNKNLPHWPHRKRSHT